MKNSCEELLAKSSRSGKGNVLAKRSRIAIRSKRSRIVKRSRLVKAMKKSCEELLVEGTNTLGL